MKKQVSTFVSMDIDEGLEEEHICNCCNMGWIGFANADEQRLVMAIVAAFVYQAMKIALLHPRASLAPCNHR